MALRLRAAPCLSWGAGGRRSGAAGVVLGSRSPASGFTRSPKAGAVARAPKATASLITSCQEVFLVLVVLSAEGDREPLR